MDLTESEEPWVVVAALVDLENLDPDDEPVRAAYERLKAHPLVGDLIASLDTWPTQPLARAYDPKDAIWVLSVLADFGMRRDDPRIAAIAERLFAAQVDDGGFLHGGFAHTKSWHERPYICIDHVQTYALARFGYLGDARLERAYAHILARQRLDGGFHPNEKALPKHELAKEPSCPFGTVNVLRALVAHPQHRQGHVARGAAEYLLECWKRRAEPHRPVGFGIGSTWGKLHYPFVQYQRLKTMDTLSLVPGIASDPRYQEMMGELEAKRRADGCWFAEGVNKPYAAFDFGQKKVPSSWITFLALRVLRRSSS